jgi:ATP-dependent RNA helicase RhlE
VNEFHVLVFDPSHPNSAFIDVPDHAGCLVYPRDTRPGALGAGWSRHTKDSALTAFLALGLAEPITRALVDEQYATPTPIQAQTIPQVLAARDVVGIAQTGTGKTAAFALPILNHLSVTRRRPEPRSCRVLVLSPTRELSAQIVESFQTYGRYLKPSVTLAIGGVPLGRQIRALAAGVDVLVATPGRLLDLMQQRAVHLDRVEVFVLDEADRMLDMGFIHDIRRIVTKLPAKRQTLFFSATMPREIADLANHMLRDPVRVAVTPAATTVETISQQIIHVDRAGKPSLLAEVLRQESVERVLVFTRTKRGADKVVRALAKDGLAAEAIHGNKSQNQRERVLAAFRAGKIRTLVATDIAARGIDIDGISHVVNYDLPNIPESYVHRIGRTARAGADGVAISFCDGEEREFLRDIEKLIRMSIPATDRRSGRRPQPEPREPRQQHANGAPHGKPRQRQNQDRRQDRQHADARPSHKPSRGSNQQQGRRADQRPNGHSATHQRPSSQKPNNQTKTNGSNQQHPRGEQPAATHEIGTIAFMQQPRRGGRRHAPGHAGQRAPR